MNICIICKSKFDEKNENHILPAGIGGDAYTIKFPENLVECPGCNNGLGACESALMDFGPLPYYRAWLGYVSRTGNKVTARYNNIRIQEEEDEILHIYHKGSDVLVKEGKVIKYNLRSNFSAKTLKKVLRALYKISLLHMAKQFGASYVLDSRFDEVRDIIRGVKDFEGYVILSVADKPTKDIRVTAFTDYKDNTTGQIYNQYQIDIFGFLMHFDSERRVLDFPEKLPNGSIYYVTNP